MSKRLIEEIELEGPIPKPRKKKKRTRVRKPRKPSLKTKLLKKLRAKRKSLNEQLRQVKRDINSLTRRRRAITS